MKLEYLLSKIQVIGKEISQRTNDKVGSREYSKYLEGVINESEILFDTYEKSRKSIKKKQFSDANRYTGEFCVAAKNLADNMNCFMQAFYSKEQIKIPKLEQRISQAPLSLNNQSLYREFVNTHNHSRKNPLIIARKMKSHGEGHMILGKKSKSKSGYVIDSNGNWEDSIDWLQKHSSKYLDMTLTILESIAIKEETRLSGEHKCNWYDITKQRIENYIDRHKKTAILTAGTVLVTTGLIAGVVGTVSYQNYSKQKLLDNLDISLSNLISELNDKEIEILKYQANYFCKFAFGVNTEEFEKMSEKKRVNLIGEALKKYPHIFDPGNIKHPVTPKDIDRFFFKYNIFEKNLIEVQKLFPQENQF